MKRLAISALTAGSCWVVFIVLRWPPRSLVRFSGQGLVFIVDENDNGPDPSDCAFQITVDFASFSIQFTPVGDMSTFRACTGDTFGNTFSGTDISSDFAGAHFTSATTQDTMTPRGLRNLVYGAVTVEAIAEGFPNGLPLEMNQIEIRQTGVEGATIASIAVCNAGGPALLADVVDAPGLLLSMSFFPDAQSPTHVKVPKLPFEHAAPNLGTFSLVDVYLPVSGHNFTAARDDAPNDLLVNVDLDALLPCPGRVGAPALSEWALIMLLLSLLVLGTWVLGRRRALVETLPLP